MGMLEQGIDNLKAKLEDVCEYGTVGGSERILSVIAGGFILGYSIKKLFKRPMTALSGMTLGSALVMRGVTGRCPVKGAIEKEQEREEEDRNLTLIERRYFEK